MATIKDVAGKAHVSTATVSYVINKNRYVSPELTARVDQAIKDLAFIPSSIAQGLRGGKTYTVGLIIDDITNRFASHFIRGLESAAAEKRYNVITSDLQEREENEERSLSMLLARKVDGIIYAGYGRIEGQLAELYARGTPVVVVDKPLATSALPSILVNNREGVHQALEHLLSMGIRQILCINGLAINQNAVLRAEAFREFMVSRDLPFAEENIVFGDFTLEHGYRTTLWLVSRGLAFRALLCGDDLIAIGAMAALKSSGFRIPEDVAVVGFDDDPMAAMFDPSLTTVHYPMFEMGRQAFQVFQKLRGHRPKTPRSILLNTRLVVRRSTQASFHDYYTPPEADFS